MNKVMSDEEQTLLCTGCCQCALLPIYVSQSNRSVDIIIISPLTLTLKFHTAFNEKAGNDLGTNLPSEYFSSMVLFNDFTCNFIFRVLVVIEITSRLQHCGEGQSGYKTSMGVLSGGTE